MTELVSVIIPSFNRANKLKNLLRSLEEQTCSKEKFEVIVIDDGSTDETEEMIKKVKTDYGLIYSKISENRGRASACNNGIKIARGKIILFLDDDMVLDKDLLAEHLKFYKDDHLIAILGMVKVLECEAKTRFERYFFRDVQYNSEKTLRGIKEREGNVPFCCCGTGNFSISRQALINAGMFDESFKVYGHEDVEFVYRLIKKKVRILFNPNAIAHHRIFPRSVDYHLKQKEMIGYSALQFYKKYPELKGILHVDEICSLKGSPSDIIRKLARVITVNRISVILLRRCLPIFEKVLPDFMLFSIYNRLSGYYLRKGLLKR